MLFLLSTLLVFTSFAASAPVLTVNEEMEQIFQNLTTEAQEDYFQILFNDTLTLWEMDQLWEQWAEKHVVSDKWAAYNGKWGARKEKFHKTVLSVIENLPSAYRMITEITSNRDQTVNQLFEAMDQLKETYNIEVSMISFLSRMMLLNEEHIINGGNVEIGNEVSQDLRRMRDYKKDRGLRALLVPGPLA